MASTAILAIKIISDAKQAQTELGKTESAMSKFRSGVGKAAVPAAIAGAAILKFGSDAVSAARAAAVEQAKLEAVFKATGDTTGKSAKIAADYASTLSRQIGVDDEVIKSGEAKLATFKNVADKASMMNGVFKRTTAVGADLAAAGFGSIDSNAVLLGKALNDPIKGMSALSRVGVTLTETQKKQAEQMQKSGDIAGAQKVILKAVEGQVKGTAAATATSADKSKVAWGEFMETMGSVLLPIVDKLTLKFASLGDWMNKNAKIVQILIGVVAILAGGILALNVALKAYEVITKAVGIVQKATWLANPIGLVILAIIAVGVALVVLYKKSKTFRDFVNKMWATIKAATKGAAAFLKAAWGKAVSAAKLITKGLSAAFKVAAAAIKAAIHAVTAVFKTVWRAAFGAVKLYVTAWREAFKAAFGVIKGAIQIITAVFKGDWRGVIDGVKTIIRTFGDFFRGIFKALPNPVQSALQTVQNKISGVVTKITNLWDNLSGKLTAPFDDLLAIVGDVIDKIGDLISKISGIHMPKISLPFGLGKSAPAPAILAPVPGMRTAGLTRGTRTGSSSAGGVTINVTGALDPDSVARQIERILRGRQRRIGAA